MSGLTRQWFSAVGALLCACGVGAETTVGDASPYAYAANAGWINLRGDAAHGFAVGLSYCTGHLWSPALGWIGVGNGPTNGWSYTQLSAADWGVNHDGLGALSGYAYGANIGWVIFEQTYGKPRVDLLSGAVSGWAWSPNIGWIGFSNQFAQARMTSLSAGPDSDGDGIADAWEYKRAGSLGVFKGNGADADNDGASDLAEFGADTDPANAASALAITAFERSAASNRVEWTVQATRQYRLQRAAALGADTVWDDSGLGLMAPGSSGRLSRQVPEAGVRSRFYRVKAVLPLSE